MPMNTIHPSPFRREPQDASRAALVALCASAVLLAGAMTAWTFLRHQRIAAEIEAASAAKDAEQGEALGLKHMERMGELGASAERIRAAGGSVLITTDHGSSWHAQVSVGGRTCIGKGADPLIALSEAFSLAEGGR